MKLSSNVYTDLRFSQLQHHMDIFKRYVISNIWEPGSEIRTPMPIFIKAALALARSLLSISFVCCCVVVLLLSAVHKNKASSP